MSGSSKQVEAQPLFRKEVLEAHDAQFLGSIRIGSNLGFTLIAIVSSLLAAALLAYSVLGEVTRKARLTGLLVPTLGTLNITTPQVGTLLSIRIAEGDPVSAGQILMTVGTDRATARGDTAELIGHSLEQRRSTLKVERALAQTQAQQRQQAYADRIRSMSAEQRQADAEIEASRRRIAFAQKSVQRYTELAQSGFVAEIQAQQKQEELIDLGSRLSSAERNLTALQRDTEALRAEQIANTGALQTQLVQIDRSVATLEQETTENAARGQLVITSPKAGTVSAMTMHVGNAVQPGQTLVTVLPEAASDPSEFGDAQRTARSAALLQAELYAPSRTAGFVQAGQSVWLRFAAYPYQKFGMAQGRVESVSRTPINPQDLPTGQSQALLSAAQSNEPMYRVSVTLAKQDISTYGKTQALKAGMALEADVVQDRRAIWEWILEPLIATIGATTASKP